MVFNRRIGDRREHLLKSRTQSTPSLESMIPPTGTFRLRAGGSRHHLTGAAGRCHLRHLRNLALTISRPRGDVVAALGEISEPLVDGIPHGTYRR